MAAMESQGRDIKWMRSEWRVIGTLPPNFGTQHDSVNQMELVQVALIAAPNAESLRPISGSLEKYKKLLGCLIKR